jgi:hypothetical protein
MAVGEQAREFVAQFLAQLVIEIGERLVEQDQVCVLDQRPRQGGALLLSTDNSLGRRFSIGVRRNSSATFPTSAAISRDGMPATRRGEAMLS